GPPSTQELLLPNRILRSLRRCRVKGSGISAGCAQGSLDAARRAAGFVRGDDVIHKNLHVAGLSTQVNLSDRAGGYTRMLRTRIRVGDAAPMVHIEFIGRENERRQSKPATPQSPPRVPLDPWARSRLTTLYAPLKEENVSTNHLR
ncbi:unnamed protein product, partial [Thlaspi arvense]